MGAKAVQEPYRRTGRIKYVWMTFIVRESTCEIILLEEEEFNVWYIQPELLASPYETV